jgi:hypothetical protein
MSGLPSIKGSVFVSIVEDVKKLLACGGIAQGELARWLRAEDIRLLGQTIGAASWYDIPRRPSLRNEKGSCSGQLRFFRSTAGTGNANLGFNAVPTCGLSTKLAAPQLPQDPRLVDLEVDHRRPGATFSAPGSRIGSIRSLSRMSKA